MTRDRQLGWQVGAPELLAGQFRQQWHQRVVDLYQVLEPHPDQPQNPCRSSSARISPDLGTK